MNSGDDLKLIAMMGHIAYWAAEYEHDKNPKTHQKLEEAERELRKFVIDLVKKKE